jgi:hypothetical protein
VVFGLWGRRDRWNSGDLACELGQGSGSRGSRGGEGPVGVLFCGGRNAGGRARREPAAAAAGSLAPVSGRASPDNVRGLAQGGEGKG